jgi:hypothetical protein
LNLVGLEENLGLDLQGFGNLAGQERKRKKMLG